ncbi:hypothetical protein BN159_2206 [Streptomyces davaonensis JCM 4913]|uniref:Uncharacterized protein n=1 Tax=Streptomyces davaonensis (strain DSM 101723 / JCM 4913 / KCC S-0913 / 768) TaxID=1214101 RepID=K4R0F9_STRDJ|nr:hypothetical protein [Streptomyces davaonensis]CCK26585.1 hypothetical protein BN159_2206 [Streptomyces davaonensis JCM 4913]
MTNAGAEEAAFFARLRRLGELRRAELGERVSLAVLARAAGVRSRETVREWLSGGRMPQDPEQLLCVVAVLRAEAVRLRGELPDEWRALLDAEEWRRLHADLAGARGRATGAAVRGGLAARALEERRLAELPDRPRPLGEWHPRALGVHPSISGASGETGFVLPEYVPREHDRRLRESLERIAAGPDAAFVLVRGESCTGKTRTAYEAVRACLPEWELAFPKDPDSLLKLLEADALGPRTVLWLDEGQDCLLGERGASAAAGLRRLLERPGPLLVLMTMWHQHHRTLTARPDAQARDPHAQARALLGQATDVRVPVAFSREERDQVRAIGDRAVATARMTSREGALTQTLAAGPELVAFYESADGAPDCYGQAVITAAMDARRLGHGPELPDALLESAAPAYLGEAVRADAGADWFANALRHARTKVMGVVAPLGDVVAAGGMGARPGVRRLADYLDHHGRTARSYVCPGAPFWAAAERFAGSASDLLQLANSAHFRGRFAVADALYARAAERGDASAWTERAYLRRDRGCREEAVEFCWKGHAAGDADALNSLAHWYLEDEEPEAARRLVPEIEATGHPRALLSLAEEEQLHDSDAEVERLARIAAELGWAQALTFLGRRRLLGGDHGAAEDLFRRAMADGDPGGAFELARLRWTSDKDVPGVVAAARRAAELGDYFTLGIMAQLVIGSDPAEGLRMAREAADLGGISASHTVRLSDWENTVRQQSLAVLADHAEATDGPGAGEALLLTAAEEGDLHVLAWLALRAWDSGDHAGAVTRYERATAGGYAPALVSLAHLRKATGDVAEAERLFRRAVDAGELSALYTLAHLWEEAGDPERAGRLSFHGLDPDGEPAQPWLPDGDRDFAALGADAAEGWLKVLRAD